LRCRRCGEEAPEGSRLCMFCGERLDREEDAERREDTSGEQRTSLVGAGGVDAAGGHAPAEPSGQGEGVPGSARTAEGGPEAQAMDLYLPPEADTPPGFKGDGSPAAPSTPFVEGGAEGGAIEPDKTVAMGPVAAGDTPPGPSRTSVRTLICPECYAENPVFNRFCQECGNPLPSLPVGSAGPLAGAPAPQLSPRETLILPAGQQPGGGELPMSAGPEGGPGKASWASSFGPADLLCALALVAGVLALTPIFRWKKGLEFGIFSHHGSFVPGGSGLFGDTRALGGPGILPYQGWEFLTVGFVLALALGLALAFLLARAGRGPMYLLSGCIALFPAAYVLFQGALPLRQQGISIRPPVGVGQVLFGGPDNAGAGPAFWVALGAGLLLLLAGFLAPPRGWGRLLTFLVFAPLVILSAFFCAACYNWNLFIAGEAGAWPGRARGLAIMAMIGWI